MPPAPSGARISYGPRRDPGDRVIYPDLTWRRTPILTAKPLRQNENRPGIQPVRQQGRSACQQISAHPSEKNRSWMPVRFAEAETPE